MTTTPMTRPTKSGVCVGKVPSGGGHDSLASEGAGEGEDGQDEEEATDEHRNAHAWCPSTWWLR